MQILLNFFALERQDKVVDQTGSDNMSPLAVIPVKLDVVGIIFYRENTTGAQKKMILFLYLPFSNI